MVTDPWTIECNDALIVAMSLGGIAAKNLWDQNRQSWISNERPRVELESLDLSQKDLRGFDFSRCRFNGCNLTQSNLEGADFSQSIFRNCDFSGSNIKNTTFYAADLKHSSNRMVGMTFNSNTNVEVNRGQLAPEMDQALIDMAHAGWVRSLWAVQRFRSPIFRFTNWITNYGAGLSRIAIFSLLVIFAFGIVFWQTRPELQFIEAQTVSIKYFFNISDHFQIYSDPLTWVGFIEIIFGLFALAVVISIFTRKFTDL